VKRFTNMEKHREAMRELNTRLRIFDRLVNVGEKSRETADRQIAIMREIAEDYAELVKGERLL
jgi:hypothetical protein